MTELDGLFKIHEATDAAIVASATLPKRTIALARDTNQLLLRKEDNALVRVVTGDRLERANPTATGTVTADAFRVSPTAGVTSSSVGTFFWDAADHTVSLVLENGSELQLGREAVQWCKNSTGTPIQNGSLVYVAGATGDNPTISLASATLGGGTGNAIGMATQTIAGNGEGMVATNISFVRGLDTSLHAPGTRLWLSTTAGQWSSTPPARPNHRVQIGFVLRQHANQGIVLLWIVRYPGLSEISDADTTGATTGQGLLYGADGVWRPGAVLALGETSIAAYRGDRGKIAYDHSQLTAANPHGTTAAQVGAAPTVHTHAADDVTSGVFNEARIPALPTSRITGLDTTLAGKSDTGHTHAYLPINNPEFTGDLYGAGSVVWRSAGATSFSVMGSAVDFVVRALEDNGTLRDYPLVINRAVGAKISIGASGGLRPVELGGNLTVGVAGSENVDIETALNVKSGYTSSVRHKIAGSTRWTEQLYQGATFRWAAHDDNGAVIDYPLTMTRAAGGEMLWGGSARPTRFMGTVRSVGAVTVDTLVGTGNRALVGSATGVIQAQDAATFRSTIGAAAAADLPNYLPVNNPTFTGTLTGPTATLSGSAQEALRLRRSGATFGLVYGVDFQGQTDDLTWVNYARLQARLASTANGAQTGNLRMIVYEAGASKIVLDATPSLVSLGTGVGLAFDGNTVVDSSRNGSFAALTASGATTVTRFGVLRDRTSNPAHGALYPTDVTPGTSNYAMLVYDDGTITALQASSSVSLAIGAATKLTATASAVNLGSAVELQQNGTVRITASGDGRFASLRSDGAAGAGTRPAVVSADGTLGAQTAAAFRDTIGALPSITLTGAVDANSINGGAACVVSFDNVASWTNFPGEFTGTEGCSLLQLVGGDAGNGPLTTQLLFSTRYGGLYHRERVTYLVGGGAWNPWVGVWDDGLLPVSTFMKSVLDDTSATAARDTLNAAVKPSVGTQSGNWTLGTSTPTGTRQTGSGTLTLPAASSTYAGLTYTVTATTSLTLTISGSFVVLDAPNTASYWYTESTVSSFLMQGGHTAGSRKTIEMYCDGTEWFVKCV